MYKVQRALLALALFGSLLTPSTAAAEEQIMVVGAREELLAFPDDRVGSLAKYGLTYEDATAVMLRNPKEVTTTCFNIRNLTDAGDGRSAGICDKPIFLARRGATLHLPESRASLTKQLTKIRDDHTDLEQTFAYTLGQLEVMATLAGMSEENAVLLDKARADAVRLAEANNAHTQHTINVSAAVLTLFISLFGYIFLMLLKKKNRNEMQTDDLQTEIAGAVRSCMEALSNKYFVEPFLKFAEKQAEVMRAQGASEALGASNEAARASLVKQQRDVDATRKALAHQEQALTNGLRSASERERALDEEAATLAKQKHEIASMLKDMKDALAHAARAARLTQFSLIKRVAHSAYRTNTQPPEATSPTVATPQVPATQDKQDASSLPDASAAEVDRTTRLPYDAAAYEERACAATSSAPPPPQEDAGDLATTVAQPAEPRNGRTSTAPYGSSTSMYGGAAGATSDVVARRGHVTDAREEPPSAPHEPPRRQTQPGLGAVGSLDSTPPGLPRIGEIREDGTLPPTDADEITRIAPVAELTGLLGAPTMPDRLWIETPEQFYPIAESGNVQCGVCDATLSTTQKPTHRHVTCAVCSKRGRTVIVLAEDFLEHVETEHRHLAIAAAHRLNARASVPPVNPEESA